MSTTPANPRLKGREVEKQIRGSSTRSEQKRNHPFPPPARRSIRPRGSQTLIRTVNPDTHPAIHTASLGGLVTGYRIALAMPADREQSFGETPIKQILGHPLGSLARQFQVRGPQPNGVGMPVDRNTRDVFVRLRVQGQLVQFPTFSIRQLVLRPLNIQRRPSHLIVIYRQQIGRAAMIIFQRRAKPDRLRRNTHWRILAVPGRAGKDRNSTRLNSIHVAISYAVFCLKKKTTESTET